MVFGEDDSIIRVSSAYLMMNVLFDVLLMSMVYIEKSAGLSTHPWGLPVDVVSTADFLFWEITMGYVQLGNCMSTL